MFNFFKRKQEEPPTTIDDIVDNSAMAPGTQLRFDDQLIPKLLDDHKVLLHLFSEISSAYERRNFKVLSNKLEVFSDGLRSHLLLENIKLYVYLKHVLKSDEESTVIMNTFRQEMKEIGKAVNGFVNKYGNKEWDEDMKASFHDDITKIGAVFTRRIETEEESLYPLYMHPNAYK